MKKIFSLLFVIFISLFLVIPSLSVVTAQERKPIMQWHCLQSQHCRDSASNCSGKGVVGHRAKLTTKRDDLPARNKETYILACISTELGNVCTTGDSQLDRMTVGYDGVAILKRSTATGGFEFQGLFLSDGVTEVAKDRIKANASGKLVVDNQLAEPLEWQDYTPKGVGRKWLALNLLETIELPVGRGGEQQGTFTFEGALRDCAAIYWDPYGIVFDSQSLEPVAEVKITLLKKRSADTYTMVGPDEVISLLNPLYTDEAGFFAFFVPDGTYKLDVLHPNFTFPNDPAKLHPNYDKVYSDIYRGEEIIQKGAIEHRDIPIDTKGVPYQSQIKLLSYATLLDKGANIYIIEGRVSHPLTKIQVFGKKADSTTENGFVKTRLLINNKTDKQGKFKIHYNLNQLEPGEFVGEIEFIKTDLRTITTVDVLGAVTPSTTLTLNPILNYIEGYAYDKNSQVIPNATVGVYLSFSNKPAYETKADEKGYFKIASEYLPPFPYELRYVSPTGVSYKVTTSNFLAQNTQFIESKKTDFYSFRNRTGQVFKPKGEQLITQKEKKEQEGNEGRLSPTKVISPIPKDAQSKNLIIIVAILLLLIIVTAILLSFYYLKKKTTSFNNPNQ